MRKKAHITRSAMNINVREEKKQYIREMDASNEMKANRGEWKIIILNLYSL
jgi:hypothetical protein